MTTSPPAPQSTDLLLRPILDRVEDAVGQLGAVSAGQADRLAQAARLAQEIAQTLTAATRAAAALAGELTRAVTLAQQQVVLATSTASLARLAARLAPPSEEPRADR